MASKKKLATLARHAAADEISFSARSRSFIHNDLVLDGPSRHPSDVRAVARLVEICPNFTGRLACSCPACERSRSMVAKKMPSGVLTARDGISEASRSRKDLSRAV